MSLENFGNTFIQRLPSECRAALEPHLQYTELKSGTLLYEADEEITHAHFPLSGLISSVIALMDGEQIEAGVVGRTGVSGAGAAIDGTTALNKTIVQIAGNGLVIPNDRLRDLATRFSSLRSSITRHEQFMYAQAQQAAACNAVHGIEERMCRWLLTISYIVKSDTLALTQEFIAQMLGVRRTSVTLVAHQLKTSGLITYTRGRVQLKNWEALEDASCECFHSVKAVHERLLLSSA